MWKFFSKSNEFKAIEFVKKLPLKARNSTLLAKIPSSTKTKTSTVIVKFRQHLRRGYAEEKITYAKPPLHDKGPYK